MKKRCYGKREKDMRSRITLCRDSSWLMVASGSWLCVSLSCFKSLSFSPFSLPFSIYTVSSYHLCYVVYLFLCAMMLSILFVRFAAFAKITDSLSEHPNGRSVWFMLRSDFWLPSSQAKTYLLRVVDPDRVSLYSNKGTSVDNKKEPMNPVGSLKR